MFRTTKEYGETPEEIRLVSGDVLLTVTKVEGKKVTGWFYTDWWNTETVVSLLKGTPCAYADWTSERLLDAQDERGDFTDPLRCECEACLIGDGLTYDRSHGEFGGTESMTVEVPYYAEPNVGDRIRVTALFAQKDVEGCEDIHGWNDRTLERTHSTRSHCWTEWTALIAEPWSTGVALYALEGEKANA